MLYKIDEHTYVAFICKGGDNYKGCDKSRENGIKGELDFEEFGRNGEVFVRGVQCEYCHAGTQQIIWKE